jgi:hypothetical protein
MHFDQSSMFHRFSEPTAIMSVNNIKCLLFIVETDFIHCAIGNESLKLRLNLVFKGFSMWNSKIHLYWEEVGTRGRLFILTSYVLFARS